MRSNIIILVVLLVFILLLGVVLGLEVLGVLHELVMLVVGARVVVIHCAG